MNAANRKLNFLGNHSIVNSVIRITVQVIVNIRERKVIFRNCNKSIVSQHDVTMTSLLQCKKKCTCAFCVFWACLKPHFRVFISMYELTLRHVYFLILPCSSVTHIFLPRFTQVLKIASWFSTRLSY